MYQKKTIQKAPADVKALMRVSNGLELELKALKREIEARRDAQVESHERLGNILETGQLFHHDDRAEDDGDEDAYDRAEGLQDDGRGHVAATATFRP